MHFHGSPTFLILKFMVVIFIIHVLIPTSHVCAIQSIEKYNNCSKFFQCGGANNITTSSKFNISYPFWGGNRAEYCGRPQFQLICQLGDDAPWLTLTHSTKYRVLGYNISSKNTLTVARQEFWNNSCPRFLNIATLDQSSIFSYDPANTQYLILYYGCSPLSGQRRLNHQFECTVNGTTSISYYANATTELNPATMATCNNSEIVRVFRSAAEGLYSNPPSLTISDALAQGFALQWQSSDADYWNCVGCVHSGGQCGYNSISSSFTCYCSNYSSPYTCFTARRGLNRTVVLIILLLTVVGVVVGGVFLVGLAKVIDIVIKCCRRIIRFLFTKKQTLNDQNVEGLIRNYGALAPNRYKYSDIKRMTNSFREKLGQGGFGGVYKGKLSDGRLVAVKLLSETKGGNGEDFVNEVASISRTSHVNVVTLLGYCYQGQKRALVYELMPNGSLDKFINNNGSPNTNSHLELKTLYQIAIGIARGLEYLHRGCNTRIVHFDIKPHNILLDEDFCPKISDFGLAKLCQRKESIVSMMGARGTVGYIAPEVFCRNFGSVSYKSDVYSYGMMVLEMIGARERVEIGSDQCSETYFPDWIYEH